MQMVPDGSGHSHAALGGTWVIKFHSWWLLPQNAAPFLPPSVTSSTSLQITTNLINSVGDGIDDCLISHQTVNPLIVYSPAWPIAGSNLPKETTDKIQLWRALELRRRPNEEFRSCSARRLSDHATVNTDKHAHGDTASHNTHAPSITTTDHHGKNCCNASTICLHFSMFTSEYFMIACINVQSATKQLFLHNNI